MRAPGHLRWAPGPAEENRGPSNGRDSVPWSLPPSFVLQRGLGSRAVATGTPARVLCRAPTEDIWKGGGRPPPRPRGPGGQPRHHLRQLPLPPLFS